MFYDIADISSIVINEAVTMVNNTFLLFFILTKLLLLWILGERVYTILVYSILEWSVTYMVVV